VEAAVERPCGDGASLKYEAKKTQEKRKDRHFLTTQAFLDTAGAARKIAEFRRGESIYSQGEAAESVMYVQKGGVKFSVVNGSGKEAVVAMFGRSDFFWRRMHGGPVDPDGHGYSDYTTTLLVIEKTSCGACSTPSMSYPTHFISYMLAHNIRVEEDLMDQLFNSCEKAPGAYASATRALWKTRSAGPHTAESFPGDPAED